MRLIFIYTQVPNLRFSNTNTFFLTTTGLSLYLTSSTPLGLCQRADSYHVEAELARGQSHLSTSTPRTEAVWFIGLTALLPLSSSTDIAQERSQFLRRTSAHCKSSTQTSANQLDHKWNSSRDQQASWYFEKGQGMCCLSQTKGRHSSIIKDIQRLTCVLVDQMHHGGGPALSAMQGTRTIMSIKQELTNTHV